MADIESSSWSETDSSNNSASPDGWKSGTMYPSEVEPVGRMMMGALKRDWDHKGPTVTSGGSANAQTLTYSVAPAAYVRGQVFSFLPGFTNTGAATLNVNGLGAKSFAIGAGTALLGNEIAAGVLCTVAYDGTNFQLQARPTGIGDIVGTPTNNNANVGSVGEFSSNSVSKGSALALTTATTLNVHSLSLTAGDWDVRGTVCFTGGATTTVNYLAGGITTTSATLPTMPGTSSTSMSQIGHSGNTPFATADEAIAIQDTRISIASTTTVYLVAQAAFGVSTASAFGVITARRVR